MTQEKRSKESLLTITESASHLNVSVATIRAWVWRRRIPSVRVGRSVRIRESDLQRIIDRGAVPADKRVAIA